MSCFYSHGTSQLVYRLFTFSIDTEVPLSAYNANATTVK